MSRRIPPAPPSEMGKVHLGIAAPGVPSDGSADAPPEPSLGARLRGRFKRRTPAPPVEMPAREREMIAAVEEIERRKAS